MHFTKNILFCDYIFCNYFFEQNFNHLFLLEYGLATEGIFRVPGESFTVDTFKRLFDSGATDVDFRGCSVHDVATLFKLYLRMLPEPLVPFKTYPSLIAIQSRYEEDNNETNYIKDTSYLIKDMPTDNQRVLKYLLSFLQDLSKYSKYTKMTSSNLALVLVPNVVRPEKDTVDTAMQSPIVQRIFEYLIENYKSVWENAKLEEEKISRLSIDKSRYSMNIFNPITKVSNLTNPSQLTAGNRKRRVTRSRGRRIPAGRFDTLREISSKSKDFDTDDEQNSSCEDFNTLRVII